MEVSVYMNQTSLSDGKPVFKRVVFVPDAFDVNSFVANMKAIFGESVIVSVLFI